MDENTKLYTVAWSWTRMIYFLEVKHFNNSYSAFEWIEMLKQQEAYDIQLGITEMELIK